MRKLWGGHYDEPTDALIERLNNSLRFDARLWRHDIQGSLAHATMLGSVGIISVGEADQLVAGLKALEADLVAGTVELHLDAEDVHTAVEG
ncbi:MAG: argininosuccinate lyase, partial [Chthonomonadales bacterium]|nr:argininosuccinate lyase [Chthonomonadales bacterium]